MCRLCNTTAHLPLIRSDSAGRGVGFTADSSPTSCSSCLCSLGSSASSTLFNLQILQGSCLSWSCRCKASSAEDALRDLHMPLDLHLPSDCLRELLLQCGRLACCFACVYSAPCPPWPAATRCTSQMLLGSQHLCFGWPALCLPRFPSAVW
jgi:hypothetical protein